MRCIILEKTGKSLKAFACFFIIAICSLPGAKAQTFTSGSLELTDYLNTFYIQEIPIEVNGLPAKMSESFGFEGLQLTLHHPRTSDLKIQLQAPDGTTCWITNRNGRAGGGNYINTWFRQFGKDGIVNAATNPFNGEYIPDGQITYFNNGSDPNGTWRLLVEDLRIGESGFLDSVSITFGKKPAIIKHRQYCNFDNATFCVCNKGKTCSLLPDLVIIPSFSKSQWQEYAWNDTSFPGQLKISVAIANIGAGPFEVNTDTSTNLNKDDVASDKRYQLSQEIYSLRAGTFISQSKRAGTIYFEPAPGHQHYHVDDWIELRLVRTEGGKRQIICRGSKVSYCLFTTGMFFEKDGSSLINGKRYDSNMPNYGLGNYNSCGLLKQGISVGGYDYYGLNYEGQFLQLPKGLKKGKYTLEIEIDPNHYYQESHKDNNIFRMEINLSRQ